MTLVFLLKCIGFITLLCFPKAHLARRNPSAGSGCQNISLCCLAADINTVRVSRTWPRSSWHNERIFLWAMTLWPDLTDSNTVHGQRGERRTRRSSDAGRSDANYLFGENPMTPKELLEFLAPIELLEFLSLETPPSLHPEQFSLSQCPISPEGFGGKKQTGGHQCPCPQQWDQDAFLPLGCKELEMGICHWREQGIPYSLGRKRQRHIIHVRGRSIPRTCNAQTEIHKDRAQSACRQLILSLEQPRISRFQLSPATRSGKAQNRQPKT